MPMSDGTGLLAGDVPQGLLRAGKIGLEGEHEGLLGQRHLVDDLSAQEAAGFHRAVRCDVPVPLVMDSSYFCPVASFSAKSTRLETGCACADVFFSVRSMTK